MALNLQEAQRLAYIRYLHQLGMDQARLPEPLCSASILMFHDAVESFLGLACEHFDVDLPREFEKYWAALAPKLPHSGLAGALGMKRMNRMRVALKHQGSHPSRGSIELATTDTSNFFASNTLLIFGIEYDTVSMVNVISQTIVRHQAEVAEQEASNGNYVLAMMRIREAFDDLFSEHSPSGWIAGESPFSFGPPLGSSKMTEPQIIKLLTIGQENPDSYHDYRRLAQSIARLLEIAEKTQAGVRMAAVGIDYPSYLRFLNLTPQYFDTLDGTRHWTQQSGYSPNPETWSFALQFVVTASLRIAAAVAQVAEPDWVTRDPWGRVQWESLTDEPHTEP